MSVNVQVGPQVFFYFNSILVSATNGHVAVEVSTQELLKTPSQLPTKTDDGLTQKMFDALEDSEGKFAII